MIYITGDIHSDVSRFSTTEFPEQMLMSKNDYVIVCGDFGLVWNGSKRENYWLDWLENKPFTTLFVSGNHENFDMLKTYPVEEWHGGKVQFIRPSIIHLTSLTVGTPWDSWQAVRLRTFLPQNWQACLKG